MNHLQAMDDLYAQLLAYERAHGVRPDLMNVGSAVVEAMGVERLRSFGREHGVHIMREDGTPL